MWVFQAGEGGGVLKSVTAGLALKQISVEADHHLTGSCAVDRPERTDDGFGTGLEERPPQSIDSLSALLISVGRVHQFLGQHLKPAGASAAGP